MLQKLSKSKASSNFWNNVGTLTTIVIQAVAALNGQETEGMTMPMLLVVAVFNVTNIMYHMNREK